MEWALYEFYYPDLNVRQQKVLWSREEYERHNSIEDEDEAKAYKRLQIGSYDFFLPGSPLFDAIETGYVSYPRSPAMGGPYRTIVKKIGVIDIK